MYIVLKTLSLCLLLLAMFTIALPQNHTKNSQRKSPVSMPRVICQGEKVPAGFVVVGYNVSAKCGSNSELVVKRPADTEIVCADSPIPDGFHAIGLKASLACTSADSNPLTNATLIERDGLVSTPQPLPSRKTITSTRTYPGDDENESPRPTQRHSGAKVVEHSAEESAPPIPSREEIEIAVRRSTVMIGMTMQDVSRAWGQSHTTDSLIEDDGPIHIWCYRRGKVYFRTGIVYKIVLLKG